MRSCKLFAAAALVLLTAACAKNTAIVGNLHEGAEKEVIVKLLDVNRFQVLDTVKTDAKGEFQYKLNIAKGKPEFIYLFYGDRQIASLLLSKGDKVKVNTDTLGVYSVEGSDESLKLQQVEKDYAAFLKEMQRILDKDYDVDAALSRCYINYYRDRVKYVVSNSHSLTVVPVLFQQVNPSFQVFSQSTDGILMNSICDSLKTVYPESRYVKALEKEAARRIALMDVENRVRNANEVGYVDISLPGIDGKSVKLSESLGKVTMVYFWASTAEQKMFNLDGVLPLYQEFHKKGFEVYAVSLDSDKSAWAAAVRNQNLPWINVCDTRGAQSPYVSSYGVGSLPMVWFIVDGEIDTQANVRKSADIRGYLKKKL
ncbi:MAG: redoxin domain-containing protein [Bacteroidales bacterium]|nr:redoxin domain-containing protein [Bacteroidales bacterium]